MLISISHSAWAIRLGAVVAGAAVTVLLAAIGRLLAGPAPGFLAGALYAIAGIGPHIEGYTFNGELAASVPSTAAVAASLVSRRRGSRPWLFAAAALGGSAILMKQSGFDGLVVVLVVALSRRERSRALALVAAGASVPLGASAIAGWASGWTFYWSALVGEHLGSVTSASRARHLVESLPAAGRDLLPLMALALAGLWLARQQPFRLRVGIVWLLAALAGVNVGGLYWPHYYVQLLPPLCLLAALALARLRDRRLAWATVAIVALPSLVFVAGVVSAPQASQELMVKYALGFQNDERIARYVKAHSTSRERVYALESRADFYFLASRASAFPYLWGQPIQAIPGALASLERILASPRRPQLVVLFQRSPLHRHKVLRAIVDRYYRQIWQAPRTGTPVLASVSSRPRA